MDSRAPLPRGRFYLRQTKSNDWMAVVEIGTTVEEVMQPRFWSFMAANLTPYDEITIIVDDGTWIAKVLVKGCDRTWAKVHMLPGYPVQLTTADVAMTAAEMEEYRIDWKGPRRMWEVIRKSDAAVVKSELENRDAAAMWLRGHLQVTS